MLMDSDVVPASLEKQIQAVDDELKKDRKKSISGISSEIVDFVYDQKSIRDLLNEFAEKLNINILYPETESITAKVTFDAGRKLTVAEAWDFVKMILEQAGYTLVLRVPGVYTVIHNSKAFTEPLPLYIGVDFNQLPDTMERIRYVYYFSNISTTRQKGELQQIITNILGAQDKTAFMFEDSSNAIILTTRADMIKAVMQLLVVLDEGGFQQSVEILKLEHAVAKDIVEFFGQVIGGGANKAAGFVSTSATPRARYFSEMIKVLNLDPENARHLNSIVIIGKPTDIEEVIKFIKKYLDIPQESGKSFFHVVELQWLQAADFATVLQNLTTAGSGGGAQSTGSIVSDIGFDPHIRIVAETVRTGSNAGTSGQSGSSGNSSGVANTVQRGANKLIIACSSRDWDRISALIQQIDVPQKQVIIEALVMDLDSTFIRKLGAQLRTQGITSSIFPKHMQAQAGLLTNNILGGVGTASSPGNKDYYNLVGDLSDILNPDGVAGTGGTNSLTTPNISSTIGTPGLSGSASSSFTGNTLGLISGGKNRTGGAWAFFQLLSQHNSSKIFTRPVIMALNNQQVSVKSSVWKNLAGNVTTGTSATINYSQEEAPVTMQFTPLISDNNTVNLQIQLDLKLWSAPDDISGGTKFVRNLGTNVSMQNGDVLVLGGVLRERAQVGKKSVPFLESIPIIGNLFASRTKDAAKNQLFIVIRATTVAPRAQGGMNHVTRAAADYMVDQLAETEEIFGSLKDPITRWFFDGERTESPSEYLQDKVTNLSKYDYGSKELELQKNNPLGWHEKATEHGGNIRIGWFSDVKSSDPAASGPATDVDMDHLAQLLQGINNPFEKRLNV